jgi:hypothetical protein
MRRASCWSCALVSLVIAACGGSGSSSSNPGATTSTFTLSATSASFAALQGSAAPASVRLGLQVTGSGVSYVGAGYRNGQTQPSWLGIDVPCQGQSCSVVLSILSTAIAPGQYTSTFAVGTADAKGNILDSQDVTVTLTVTARIAIAGTAYSGTFAYGGSRTQDAVSLAVHAPGRDWTAASDATWLGVPAAVQTGDVTLSAVVDVSGLAPGKYQGHVTVTSASNAQDTASLAFSVEVTAPTLTVTQSSILLGGADGLSSSPQPLAFTLGAGSAAHAFTLELTTASGGNWLQASATSGLVDASGITIQLSADRTGLVGGTYAGQVKVTVAVGDITLSKTLPVTFNLEANRIVVGAAGVGLSSWPGRSVLSRNVGVFSTVGRTDVPWTATSDQGWLSVTSSGTTVGSITLTADATGLAAGTTYFATVNVTSSDPTVENDQTIRVGLTVLGAAPADQSLAVAATYAAASPVEPIVFLHNGGADITGYDVYAAKAVRTFTGVVAAAGAMAVSGDGRTLFVYDTTNFRVTALDAVTGAFLRNYTSTPLDTNTPYGGGILAFQPGGAPALITPSSRVYDLATGTEYAASSRYSGAIWAYGLSASAGGGYVATQSSVDAVKRTALNGGGLIFNHVAYGEVSGADGQGCVSADATMAYFASGGIYNFPGISIASGTKTQVLPGAAYPDAVLCLWNGIVVGGTDSYYAATDVWVYDGPTGTQLAGKSSSVGKTSYRALLTRGLAASADATRIVTLVGLGGYMAPAEIDFQTLPPPP